MHVRNRYNTESVFVLEHADTPKPAVNAACQAVAYQEESHTTNPTSSSMHVFAFMRKLDGRKHALRAHDS